ncbi:zinc transporter ZIP1 isoform X2 [Diachasma alloeum]|uniref:zinc transporter ZIP1 isoform X2 n=1 Tax=Diachasma alloeum TaxID=454923 RepID=UPI0007381F83|nr:zinc transporter ZIP1 isoform X2 [Diachasma alloeum]XP_015115715.1 zinc transporter ZIP1 isoform X2 [Diachasma alloeum]XP_015115716.1 zinc transporter ZIP1 isoform X2 [Diachasma alloeum]XP_015115717.1 zinc transporter ZIP1 isoform X2 [Diachasma alloeum]
MAPHEDHTREFLLGRISQDVNITNDNDATAVLTAKAVTMVVLCTVSICVGLIPIQISRCLKWSSSEAMTNPKSFKIVGMLLAFGGGVLFSTTFLHMLPEVEEHVGKLIADGSLPTVQFPLAQIFVCTGFFIMYLVEEIVHSRLRRQEKKCAKHMETDVNRSTNELVENGQISYSANGHSPNYGHGHSHLPAVVLDDKSNFVLTSLRGLLIVLGLSVHELFEGLAIGLESSANYVWYMFAAVAVHKFVIAFCIGVELIASKTNRWLSIAYVCTFAIVSPLGIGIGMLLTGGEQTVTSGPLPVILQGIATGTLLYVVFFEILQHHRDGIHQYLSILFGFIVMFGLQIATSHAHSHSHSHGHSHGHSHEGEESLESEHHHDHGDGEHVHAITDTIDRLSSTVAEAVTKAIMTSKTES